MISGAEIRDIKTKYSTPKASDYSNSCQWKLYLDILEAERFCFDVFEFRGYSQDKCIDEEGIDDVRELKLVPFDTVVCDRYNSMEQDNRALVNEFCKYIEMWIKEQTGITVAEFGAAEPKQETPKPEQQSLF